jgi:putative ABC transport system permease protein
MVYQPIAFANLGSLTTVLRFEGDARPLMQAIRGNVQAIDPRLAARPETVAAAIARDADRYTAVMKLTGLPAGVALFLSIVGVYGLTTFAAAHRTKEIGVRIACGARTQDIVGLFLGALRRPFIIGVLGAPWSALCDS